MKAAAVVPTKLSEGGPGAALHDYARKELEFALACLAWRGSRRHDGVHKGRKSLRRTRATLALAEASFGRAGKLIDRELQRINRSYSELRDGHALVESLDRLARSEGVDGDPLWLRRARRAAEGRRAALGRKAKNTGAVGDDPEQILAVLLPALSALPWQELSVAELQAAWDTSAAESRAAACLAVERGGEEDWHRCRRRLRRQSQQHRALDAIPLVVDHKGLKSLAEHLGEAQDFSLLIDHCGKRSPFAPVDRKGLRMFAGLRLHQLRQELRAAMIAQYGFA